ncbi:MAG: hypothetical protein AAGH74_08930 [Pseudomonadota bacterium]
MRAIFALALMPLMACEQEFNEGLSRVAILEPAKSPLSISFACDEGPAISVIFFERDGTVTVAALGVGQEVLYTVGESDRDDYHYRSDAYELKGTADQATWSKFGVYSTSCQAVGDRI